MTRWMLLLVSLPLNAQILFNQSGYLSGDHLVAKGAPDSQVVLLDQQERPAATLVAGADGWLKTERPLSPGWYKLEGSEGELFPIGPAGQEQTLELLVRAYRYQHAGRALLDGATGFRRPAGHGNDAILARGDTFHREGQYVEVRGGWYDAGDYGKYLATTTITAARLLDAAKQLAPSRPELAEAMLKEAQVGLDWLPKMQRPDGAFYRKVSGARWPEMVPPHLDRQPRYLYGISTPDTAKAVAVLAMAARQLADRDPQRAQRYLESALEGWHWLRSIPRQHIDWRTSDDGGSGPYIFNRWDQQPSLNHDRDDRFWAAVELYLTTGEKMLLPHIRAKLPESLMLFEWKDPSLMGALHLMEADIDPLLSQQISIRLLARCRQLAEQARDNPYRVANRRFILGSNKMVAEQGVMLAHCHTLEPNSGFLELAWNQWHYLAGLNPLGQSYITGVGHRPVAHLHHIWARSAGIVPPGMMVGGPNGDSQAGIAPKGQGMRSYVDDERDYSVNEFAIDYNAAAIGLVSLLLTMDGEIPSQR
ncbi:glycoside hydrolase family 9 protein [Ferrimonas futtsuensis]|uniref:glycoside hydrolase family 9 protein n=1 Tax=Ferrimonas futtsuensis TaxID=364764 RepID=UPI000683ED24|nr:glycoside hydrolase family 9 protein [Ferrimonas futtsuensis]